MVDHLRENIRQSLINTNALAEQVKSITHFEYTPLNPDIAISGTVEEVVNVLSTQVYLANGLMEKMRNTLNAWV